MEKFIQLDENRIINSAFVVAADFEKRTGSSLARITIRMSSPEDQEIVVDGDRAEKIWKLLSGHSALTAK